MVRVGAQSAWPLPGHSKQPHGAQELPESCDYLCPRSSFSASDPVMMMEAWNLHSVAPWVAPVSIWKDPALIPSLSIQRAVPKGPVSIPLGASLLS